MVTFLLYTFPVFSVHFGYDSSIDPTAAHRVRPAAAGVGIHGGAEEGAGSAAQGAGDVALPDGLLDHGRVALRATAPPTASGTKFYPHCTECCC